MSNDEVANELHRYDREAHVFEELYARIEQLLERFGRPDFIPDQPPGDYTVHGDYGGNCQAVIFVNNLKMLRPAVVAALQNLIKDYAGWQISMTVAIRDHREWPNMGLYIRPHEIIDGLQRQYFPNEFQDIEYEGARRGTAYD